MKKYLFLSLLALGAQAVLDLHDAASGLYLLRIATQNGTFSKHLTITP